MDYVIINNQRFNLKKNLQDFVKYTMQKLLETNSISEDEVNKLQDKDYCKRTFNLKFPLLSKDKFAYSTDKDHLRYYTEDGFYINETAFFYAMIGMKTEMRRIFQTGLNRFNFLTQ